MNDPFFHFTLVIFCRSIWTYKNTFMLVFYSSHLKDCFFFCSLEKSPWYVPAKYWNKQHRSKYISPIFILQLIFAFPQNSYFHIIFTVVVLAQIRKIICWGKRIKGTQMSQFLYLSIQDCQTWKEIYLEKLNVRTSIRICKTYRINTVNQ